MNNLLTRQSISNILEEITYKDSWSFTVQEVEDGFVIKLHFYRIDATTGRLGISQNMRRWFIENWRDEKYVYTTAFMAIQTTEEHECRELFKYKGEAIFSPHSSYLEV